MLQKIVSTFKTIFPPVYSPSRSLHDSFERTIVSVLDAYDYGHKGQYVAIYVVSRAQVTEALDERLKESIRMLKWKGINASYDYTSEGVVVTAHL